MVNALEILARLRQPGLDRRPHLQLLFQLRLLLTGRRLAGLQRGLEPGTTLA